MKIIADRDIPFLQGVLEPFAEIVYMRGDEIRTADVRDADAVLTRTRTRCDAALLNGSRVRFIGTATIGFDHIDMAYCATRGIAVATAAGCNARGVLQWVGAVLAWLADRRRIGSGDKVRGLEPGGVTLGVVGVGNVGSLVKQYAENWGFRVMCSDPPREHTEGLGVSDGFYPLNEIVTECDVLTFHVPLTSETRHMVNREMVKAMKPEAVVLNSARGAVVAPDALEGRKYVIDVWNDEPFINRRVLANALLGTPHIAGYSLQGKANGTAMTVNALAAEFGLPLQDWFPEGVSRSRPRPVSWEEMSGTMPAHFDIAAESTALKAAPERFETMRDNYNYRIEYF